MTYRGSIQNGVVEFDEPVPLEELERLREEVQQMREEACEECSHRGH